MKTIFIDIDGTLVTQLDNLSEVILDAPNILPGVLDKFDSWNWKGYKIIITTGRKESTREATEKELRSLGLFWDYLIMGLDAGGERILINNSDGHAAAKAITVKTNQGLEKINL
tara:strand:- start:244 stop:585 length:342 start_codon:yes stop_codon:yes gene_type:complete